jgi:hypothetical protein
MPDPIFPVVNSINWKLIDTTESMMDRGFCDDESPLPWQSSIALYAFEPAQEDVQESLCSERLIYLKVTTSITGYLPGADDNLEVFGEIAEVAGSEYLACYGALVNISVFPPLSSTDDLSTYPRIVDFEPKQRDLIETKTETGEVLVGSATSVQLDKSASQTFGRETGLSHTGKYTSPQLAAGQFEASHTISGKWTNSAQEGYQVNVDGSKDRQERFSHETTINQLYNLLTGYHAGTNRATFLMLARPHVLQPTDRRTFVQGLRQIEGMQDFFVVVRRPQSMSQLRIEVGLDTGHFPEHPLTVVREPDYEYDTRPLEVKIPVQGSGAVEGRLQLVNEVRRGYEIDGWEFDPTRNMGGSTDEGSGIEVRGAVRLLSSYVSEGMHASDIKTYDFSVTSPDTFNLTARIERGLNAGDDMWVLNFRIYRRRLRRASGGTSITTDSMLITRRKLCTALEVDARCARRIPPQTIRSADISWITGESLIAIPAEAANAALKGDAGAALKYTLAGIRKGLTSTSASPFKYPQGTVKFKHSDHVFRRLSSSLPNDKANLPLTQLGCVPKNLNDKLRDLTVGKFASLDTASLRRYGLGLTEVIAIRKEMLNLLENR